VATIREGAWKKVKQLIVTVFTKGGLFALKGLPGDPVVRVFTMATDKQLVSSTPFGEWRGFFTPQRVAIETNSGTVVQERVDPLQSFSGHNLFTPWDLLHIAYFAGYAMWNYINVPFFFTLPGFSVEEIPSWKEGSEVWRGLRVSFPKGFATHCQQQDFYFGSEDFLLRRHDYIADVLGGLATTQYVSDYVEVRGIKFPTKRRIYVRAADLNPIRDLLLVSLDLSNFILRHADEVQQDHGIASGISTLSISSSSSSSVAPKSA